VRFKHFFIQVAHTDEKSLTHLLQHLYLELLKTATHRSGLLVDAPVKPHSSILDGLDKHTHDGVGKGASRAQGLLDHTTKLDQGAAVKHRGVILAIYLKRDTHKHLHHSVHQLCCLELLTDELLVLRCEEVA